MTERQSNDPLHGMTLEMILTELVRICGWEKMGQKVRINCFNNEPSIKSSLQFLRKTPWARKKVEAMYLQQKKSADKKSLADLRTDMTDA